MNDCDNASLQNIFSIVKRLMLLIQVCVPIMLIIWGTVGFINLIKNPDDDIKNRKKIINKFIAAAIVFFIPFIVDVAMNMVGNNMGISKCWNEANNKLSVSSSYEKIYEGDKKSINLNPEGYEKGEKKTSSSTTSNDSLYGGGDDIVSSSGYVKGPRVVTTSPYGEALAAAALNLASSAIGTNYLTLEDAKKAGCDLSGDGRLHVPNVEHSSRYRAVLPQTKNILKFWDDEKKKNLGGIGWYGPASCSPWIGSLLRYMGYDNNISTAAAKNEAPVSPWTKEKITNCISAHGIGTYMYNHPESFDNVAVDSGKLIRDQCLPGDILAGPTHIMIYVGNNLASKAFPGTYGDMMEAAENGRCYPGVTDAGKHQVGNYKVFRVKKAATITNVP